MKYTIKDLAEGKCAVRNNGTPEELSKVLIAAFGSGNTLAIDNFCYYRRGHNTWQGTKETLLPIQSVKDFIVEEYAWGDDVEYNFTADKWEDGYKYVGVSPFNSKMHLIIAERGRKWTVLLEEIRKPVIVELTMVEIAEKFNLKPTQIKIV